MTKEQSDLGSPTPNQEWAAEKDPPYLAELIAELISEYPTLTRDKARELLLAAGA
jgi:hypothetical protein